jgi:general secretion pathway protein C
VLKTINKTTLVNWLEGRGARRAAVIVNLLLAIVIARVLVSFSWLSLMDLNFGVVPPLAPPNVSLQQQNRVDDIAKLTRMDLFGVFQAPANPVQEQRPKEKEPPKPLQPLVLNLLGILYSPDQNIARAMIQERGKPEDVYSIGTQIANRATVTEITRDSVILVHNDRSRQVLNLEETLISDTPLEAQSLPGSSAAGGQEEAPQEAEPEQTTADAPNLSALREELVASPDKIIDYIRFAPVSRGRQFLGFRVSPGRNPEVFNQIGLRSGDIITSVDDVPLDNPQRGFEVAQKIASAQQLNLTVRRGGSERNITVRF